MATREMEDKHVVTFIWKIENMSCYEAGMHGRRIDSRRFIMRGFRTTWQFSLFPKGKNEGDDHLRFYMHCFGQHHPMDVELSILGHDGSSLLTETVRNCAEWICSFSPFECVTYEEVFVTRKSTFLPNDTFTVRCRIWQSEGNFPRSECVFFRSQIDVFRDSFQWPIQTFSRLSLEKRVTTEVYLYLPVREISLSLVFSLRGLSLVQAVAQIEITFLNIDKELLATLKVSVLDNEQKTVKSVEEKRVFDKSEEEQSWVLPPIARRKVLLSRQSDCLGGDVLTLFCEITAVDKNISNFITITNQVPTALTTGVARNDAICTDPSSQTGVEKNDSICSDASCQTDVARSDSICSDTSCKSKVTLGEDFLSLYRDQTGSDFELRSGDVSFPVHKQVLMARSPVFSAMFCSDMRESGTHSLDVPDVDAHTLNRMLTFLYVGTVDPDLQWEVAAKLYYAADKYQVQSLKQRCSSVLQSGLSVSNVGDVLTLADRHQDQELMAFVHDFFLRRFDDIVQSDEWATFLERNSILAGTTMTQVYKKKLERTRSQCSQGVSGTVFCS